MTRSTKIILYLLLILIAVSVAIWSGLSGDAEPEKASSFITYKDPNLTAEEKQAIVDNVSKLTEQLNSASSTEDRFKLTMQIGLQYFVLGEFSKAKSQYEQALRIDKDNPTAWAELYVVENEMQDYSAALKSIDKALLGNPSSAQYWRWKIDLSSGPLGLEAGPMEEIYKKAISETGKAPEILALYSKFLLKQGRKDEAVAALRQAQEVRPDLKDLYEGEIKSIESGVN